MWHPLKLVTVPVKTSWIFVKGIFSPSYVDDVAGAGKSAFVNRKVTDAATKAGTAAGKDAEWTGKVARFAGDVRMPLTVVGGVAASGATGYAGAKLGAGDDDNAPNTPADAPTASSTPQNGNGSEPKTFFQTLREVPKYLGFGGAAKDNKEEFSGPAALMFGALAAALGLTGAWASGATGGTLAMFTGVATLVGVAAGGLFGGDAIAQMTASSGSSQAANTPANEPAANKEAPAASKEAPAPAPEKKVVATEKESSGMEIVQRNNHLPNNPTSGGKTAPAGVTV